PRAQDFRVDGAKPDGLEPQPVDVEAPGDVGDDVEDDDSDAQEDPAVHVAEAPHSCPAPADAERRRRWAEVLALPAASVELEAHWPKSRSSCPGPRGLPRWPPSGRAARGRRLCRPVPRPKPHVDTPPALAPCP